MKIGSVAWGWTPIPEEMPKGDSLERIADSVRALGYELIDYLSTYESLDSFFTESVCRRVGGYARDIGLETGVLVFQSDLWNSPDPCVQNTQLHYLRKCVQAAHWMGASMVSCIIPGPFGAKPNRKGSAPEKIALNLPADYCWRKDWDLFVSMLGKACDIAADSGLKIAMECFPNSLCSTPHAMLQMIKDVDRPNFGIQLDTNHLAYQRIDIETAIYMLGCGSIFNVHAKDSDCMTRDGLPPGCGVVDYTAVIRALGNVGYRGNISVEVEFTDNPRRYMRQGLDHLRLCMAGEY